MRWLICITEKDTNLDLLKGKKVAVIGYGNQGHAHSLNLHDSGIDVTVGLYVGSKAWEKAEEAGLKVELVSEAVKNNDIVMILIPDEKQREVYKKEIAPYLTEGKAVSFCSWF